MVFNSLIYYVFIYIQVFSSVINNLCPKHTHVCWPGEVHAPVWSAYRHIWVQTASLKACVQTMASHLPHKQLMKQKRVYLSLFCGDEKPLYQWTFNSRLTALVDIPTVSMPITCSLKTCDICGIVLCDKTAHCSVAFYCGQPKGGRTPNEQRRVAQRHV